MKNILFISHELSRTGAPKVLYLFLKWLSNNKKDIRINLLALETGGMEKEFEEVVDEIIFWNKKDSAKPSFLKRFTKPKSKRELQKDTLEYLAQKEFDLIYANTIVSIPVALRLRSINPKPKLVAHVHELDTVLKLLQPNFSELAGQVDGFIAASEIVSNSLTKNYNIPQEKVDVLYEFTEISNVTVEKEKNERFIVGGMGTVHWRKGSDLFIQVARELITRKPDSNIEFQWLGSISKSEAIILNADLEKAGLGNRVSFLGERKDPMNVIKDFDLFLLCSREDPFPLAAIEVAMLGKPLICFEGATGTEEVLKNGGGEIIPYLDTGEMAQKIIEYYEDPHKLSVDGNKAMELFATYTPENICPKIFDCLTENHSV